MFVQASAQRQRDVLGLIAYAVQLLHLKPINMADAVSTAAFSHHKGTGNRQTAA
jgi:hypothetical protein